MTVALLRPETAFQAALSRNGGAMAPYIPVQTEGLAPGLHRRFAFMGWPDFDKRTLDEAITSYQSRERRFGRTSEQVREAARMPEPALPAGAARARRDDRCQGYERSS